ncbi:hypothetical protein GCM10010313_26000 [Streptomyces violarus]|nr:hypothetical protein GCM10010313_26000 [Streptomyces violarus]
MLGGQLALVVRVRGVRPHRDARQLTLVRHQDALVLLNVEDLRGGERQCVPRDIRVHPPGELESGRRPTAPHLGDPALAQHVNKGKEISLLATLNV